MQRPEESDREVIALAVAGIIRDVMEWMADGGGTDSEASATADLSECILGATDGYDFCKRLERRRSWECDRELVDILDNADMWGAHRAIEKKWIAAYRVYPSHEVGAAITFEGHPATIYAVDLAEGKYHIFCEALGHVREGQGTHGRIMPWEAIDGKVNALGLTINGPLFESAA